MPEAPSRDTIQPKQKQKGHPPLPETPPKYSPTAPLAATLLRTLVLDLSPAVLPILVIVLVKAMTSGDLSSVLQWPEWSFAAIVLYGVAIAKHLRLKARIQKDISYRLEAGSRLLMVLTVLAAIVLALAILAEQRVVTPEFLGPIQLLLVALAVVLTIVAEWSLQDRQFRFRRQPWTLSRRQYYSDVQRLTRSTIADLETLAFVLSSANHLPRASPGDYFDSRLWTEEMRERLYSALIRIEELARINRSKYLLDVTRRVTRKSKPKTTHT